MRLGRCTGTKGQQAEPTQCPLLALAVGVCIAIASLRLALQPAAAKPSMAKLPGAASPIADSPSSVPEPPSSSAESDDGPTLMRVPEGAMTVADTTLPHGARSPLVANAPVPQLARAAPAVDVSPAPLAETARCRWQ